MTWLAHDLSASINSTNELFKWVPTHAAIGTNIFAVQVTEDGSPMSDSESLLLLRRPVDFTGLLPCPTNG